MLFRIAIRNIFRHKRRTILTILTMGFGLMLYIFGDSLFTGIDRMMVENMVSYTDGSLIVTSKEYAQHENGFSLKYPLKDTKTLMDRIKNFSDVEGITMRIPFLTEIVLGDKSLHVIGYVIDPDTDPTCFNLDKRVVSGRFLKDDDSGILLGRDLARELGVQVGDTITLIVQTRYETANARDFTVVGILKTTSPQVDESGVFISTKGGEALLDMAGEWVTMHIRVTWPKGEPIQSYQKRVIAMSEQIAQAFPEYRVKTFVDLYGDMMALMQQKKGTIFLMTFLLLVIAGVGIVNTILMAVYERIKEIGVMRAMGFSPRQIQRIFLLEGTVLGVLGGVLGLLMGTLVNLWLIYSGYNVEALVGDTVKGSDFGFPVWGIFYGEWHMEAYILAFVFAMVTALLAAYIPARHAGTLQVTDCLKFV
ncbi:ABC transporter permease [Thermospira aquatica]|uniref:ABC transporter permease n=1 Tax=Thermospira aquatica TaxID=2828656 RepID=A0AAX3BCR7_9SPIR|nr:FtsX-like permease family protein [Thermospira aquatica]URA09888.1 ABC transporter permease [Thermospira aquatica]